MIHDYDNKIQRAVLQVATLHLCHEFVLSGNLQKIVQVGLDKLYGGHKDQIVNQDSSIVDYIEPLGFHFLQQAGGLRASSREPPQFSNEATNSRDHRFESPRTAPSGQMQPIMTCCQKRI